MKAAARTSLFLVLLLAIGLIAIGLLPPLRELPWTQHAKSSHVGEWNVENILPKIDQRACYPIVIYSCPSRHSVIYTCPAAPGSNLWLGLVIGIAQDDPVVVTGYAAPKSYWEGMAARDRCSRMITP